MLDFSLSDQVFARARVADVSSVNLWLGAGVMLEYPLEEAQALLERQLAGCKQQLEVVQWEHEYIKDQLTTTEVRRRAAAGGVLGRRRRIDACGALASEPPVELCSRHQHASRAPAAGLDGPRVQLGRAESASGRGGGGGRMNVGVG